jgi:hypothetical protein
VQRGKEEEGTHGIEENRKRIRKTYIAVFLTKYTYCILAAAIQGTKGNTSCTILVQKLQLANVALIVALASASAAWKELIKRDFFFFFFPTSSGATAPSLFFSPTMFPMMGEWRGNKIGTGKWGKQQPRTIGLGRGANQKKS